MSELRDRDEIERDRKSAIATGALWYLDTAGLVWRAEGPERLIADVGPLLERLDRTEKMFNALSEQYAIRGERLDQQTAEIERLRSAVIRLDTGQSLSVEATRAAFERDMETIERLREQLAAAQVKSADWRRLWRDRYRNLWEISEQYRAELAAAQARAEAVRAMHQPHKSVWTPSGWRKACGLDGALYPCPTLRALDAAGAAALPLPEPEQPPSGEEICHCGQPVDTSEYRNRGMCTHCDDVRCDAYPGECKPKPPRHQPASSFGYAYCAVCRADWPCHAAKERA